MSYICPVCGYPELRKDPNSIPHHGFCPSCFFQFRVTDDDEGYSYAGWREKWIKEGMNWGMKHFKSPAGWNPVSQLENLKKIDVSKLENFQYPPDGKPFF